MSRRLHRTRASWRRLLPRVIRRCRIHQFSRQARVISSQFEAGRERDRRNTRRSSSGMHCSLRASQCSRRYDFRRQEPRREVYTWRWHSASWWLLVVRAALGENAVVTETRVRTLLDRPESHGISEVLVTLSVRVLSVFRCPKAHTGGGERSADPAESCRYGHLRHPGSGKSGASRVEQRRAAPDVKRLRSRAHFVPFKRPPTVVGHDLSRSALQAGTLTRSTHPMRRVRIVSGMPTRQYATKPISTRSRRATSTTMTFATDPRSVRLPAKVEAVARSNQPRVGSPRLVMTGLSKRTAGTFETMLERTAATVMRTAGRWIGATAAVCSRSPARPEDSTPPTTTNNPVKRTSKLQ